ncbi:hypothetical protein DBV15_09981 [Temnothorax longispinosus]|uniref:Uncharacterized protein n=1 Tax=Temnothorax longispinosus TaxID=300112 RepID=A0A4V3SBH2_9HYME|nr:hypothetical protein DBV15_09981 [Temnothorax longispinosus]
MPTRLHNCGTRTQIPLDLLFLDDRQAAVVHQRAGPSGEREDPIIQLAPLLHEEGQGDRQIAALLPHEETLVLVTLDRRVPEIQYAERLADLLLRIDHGEVLHAGAIDLHLHTLPMTVRPDQGHVAAHVLGVPAGVHVRVLQTRLVVPQEVGDKTNTYRYTTFRSGIQLAQWGDDKIIDPLSRLEPVYQAIKLQFFRRSGGYSGHTNCNTRSTFPLDNRRTRSKFEISNFGTPFDRPCRTCYRENSLYETKLRNRIRYPAR